MEVRSLFPRHILFGSWLLLAASLAAAQAPVPKPAPMPLPPAATVEPKVVLSAAHAKACKVKVGDTLPMVMVQDAQGQAKPLTGLLGPNLTLVIFWNSDNKVSVEEVTRLPKLVAGKVPLVAVHSGKGEGKAAEAVNLTHTADSTAAALSAFCTDGKVPRTYLVDKTGKVLWFDIEYSIDTERQLLEAIRFYSK